MGSQVEELSISEQSANHRLTRDQIRGSSLLLFGRLISVGVNFLSQVLVVRYLSTADYGAWAYALSVVAFFQGFATLGLDRAVTRFVPIYEEKREYNKLLGTLVLVVGSTVLVGILVIVGLYAFPGSVARLINDKQQPLALLSIIIFLVPVQALDGLLIGVFASFGSPRTIFFRRYILGPGLKLLVVSLLVSSKSSLIFLAYGYLGASILGVLIYGWVLFSMLRTQGLLARFSLRTLTVPAREIFAFTIPLMTSDLVTVLMHSSDALLLGYFCDLKQVAFFRVVLPLAVLNQLVMNSFALLYTPAASRLFARGDKEGINDLYWRTAVWMAVVSFPIFAVTFSLAKPLTVRFYGARYGQSATILALLSLGYYFNTALGFNGLTLKVLMKLRYIVTVNILAAVTNVVVNLLLIPRYGALGAAIGTAGTLIAHNIFKQTGLRLASGISLFDRRYSSLYAGVGAATAALLIIHVISPGGLFGTAALTVLVSAVVFIISRRKLKLKETFPELARLPFMRLLFA
jgi:O-antigen/teichoic acid export membrane protein